MVGVTSIDALPDIFHFVNLLFIFKFVEEHGLEFAGDGTRKDARNVHIRIASASKTKINKTDDAILIVEQDITKIEIAMNELGLLGRENVMKVVGEMFFIMTIIKLF